MKSQVEICILAGGLSSRMGRDKSKLRLDGKTLLTRIRQTARSLGHPVRAIRRDLVPRCGPLGGIYTALKTTRAESIMFLACDMPNISGSLLKGLLRASDGGPHSVFTSRGRTVEFPFVLHRNHLEKIEKLLAEKEFSLQTLARRVRAKRFRPNRAMKSDLLNVNTPEDWESLQMFFKTAEVSGG